MKRRGNIGKMLTAMVLGIVALGTVGFSAWVVSSGNASGGVVATINGANVEEMSTGFGVSVTPLKMGTYFYENNQQTDNDEVGYLTYTFSVTPSSLPTMLKHSSGSGYGFSLSGSLTFSADNAVNLFSSAHIETAAVATPLTTGLTVTSPTLTPSDISNTATPNYGMATVSAFNVVTASTGSSAEQFSVAFGFKQSLLWEYVPNTTTSYRSLLETGHFVLKLQGGAIHE